MNSKILGSYKVGLTLSLRQREILVGTLLGDAHLETRDQGSSYRLKIEHALKQKEYVDWLYEQFKDWTHTAPQQRTRTSAWKADVTYEHYWFTTLSASPLRFYGQQFYCQGKKVVPHKIDRWLTPLGLAIWYMDDGSIKSRTHSTVLFNTQGFNTASIARLQEVLLKKFGIKSTLRQQKEGKQIYLLSETINVFRQLIAPYILSSMRYKLPKVWLTQLPKQ